MKTILSKIMIKTMGIISICLLLVFNLANCQILEKPTETPQLETYDFHMQKYKTNLTVGRVLVVTSGVCFITGIVLVIADVPDAIVDSTFEGEGTAGTDLSSGIMIGGIVTGLASIPFFIKANEHKKKANLLLVTTQTTLENTRLKMPKNIGVSLIIPID